MNRNQFFMMLFIISLFLPLLSADTGNYVRVIYFHGENRCQTCIKIEGLCDGAMKDYFKNQIQSGTVKWEVINFDEKKNEHYVDKFELYSQTLILIKYKNGKETDWKSLEKIWQLYGDKQKFYNYVKKEVDSYLKGL